MKTKYEEKFMSGTGSYLVRVKSLEFRMSHHMGPMMILRFRIVESSNQEHPARALRTWVQRLPTAGRYDPDTGDYIPGRYAAPMDSESIAALKPLLKKHKNELIVLSTEEKMTRKGMPFTVHRWHKAGPRLGKKKAA